MNREKVKDAVGDRGGREERRGESWEAKGLARRSDAQRDIREPKDRERGWEAAQGVHENGSLQISHRKGKRQEIIGQTGWESQRAKNGW